MKHTIDVVLYGRQNHYRDEWQEIARAPEEERGQVPSSVWEKLTELASKKWHYKLKRVKVAQT